MSKNKPENSHSVSPLDATQPVDQAARKNWDCYQEIASVLWNKNVVDPLTEAFSRREAGRVVSNIKNDDAMVAAYADV